MPEEWWERSQREYREDGRRDAEKGFFDPPHGNGIEGEFDPQYDDENQAYKAGFMERRKELGDKFKWL